MHELIPAVRIRRRVEELGEEIARDYARSDDLVLVGLLRGSVCFLADLMRAIDRPLRIECLDLRSYNGYRAGEVIVYSSELTGLEGADVIIVDDVLDRGRTIQAAIDMARSLGPASVEACTLLRKDVARSPEVSVRYVGFDIGPDFVVGYGLDYSQRFRNLPFVGIPSASDLSGWTAPPGSP
ncbi:MAG: phosphoribosyltransferase [Hyphomicrobiales bacterium]